MTGSGWIAPVGVLARLDRIRRRYPAYKVTTCWRGREAPMVFVATGSLDTHPYIVVSGSLDALERALAGSALPGHR